MCILVDAFLFQELDPEVLIEVGMMEAEIAKRVGMVKTESIRGWKC